MRPRPTIVVLAAGRGRRFAGPLHKLEQPLGGAAVLARTVRAAVQSQLPLVVVATAAREPLLRELVAGRDIVVLDDERAARGMGHSIAVGVAERSGAPGWLVLPGDLPLVRPGTLLAVAAALEQHPVAFAQHRGRRGHAVGFAAELYSELVRLDGDDGARRLIARYPAQPVEVDDPGVLLDVDSADDLARAEAALQAPVGAAAPLAGPP